MERLVAYYHRLATLNSIEDHMLAFVSIYISRKLSIIGRYNHNITKYYAVLMLLVYKPF